MPTGQERIQVEVLGEVFIAKDNSAAEELRKTTAFLNERLTSLQARYPSLSAKKLAVLAALHLADELLQVRNDYEALISILDNQ